MSVDEIIERDKEFLRQEENDLKFSKNLCKEMQESAKCRITALKEEIERMEELKTLRAKNKELEHILINKDKGVHTLLEK